MNLTSFLIKAKKNTYASGNSSKKLEDGFEEFIFEEGMYRYRDRYYAKDPHPFGGEEVVWWNGNPVWMMNYYGSMISTKVNSKDVYTFLRSAMSLVNEKRPFRGPSQFKKGDFEYKDESWGDVNQFRGTERILFKGEEVYSLEYHGGTLN